MPSRRAPGNENESVHARGGAGGAIVQPTGAMSSWLHARRSRVRIGRLPGLGSLALVQLGTYRFAAPVLFRDPERPAQLLGVQAAQRLPVMSAKGHRRHVHVPPCPSPGGASDAGAASAPLQPRRGWTLFLCVPPPRHAQFSSPDSASLFQIPEMLFCPAGAPGFWRSFPAGAPGITSAGAPGITSAGAPGFWLIIYWSNSPRRSPAGAPGISGSLFPRTPRPIYWSNSPPIYFPFGAPIYFPFAARSQVTS